MLKILTVALENDKLQPMIYAPTPTTIGVQLNHVQKGLIVDVCQIDGGYSLKLFEVPQGAQKGVLKASKAILSSHGDSTNDYAELDLCKAILDKFFSQRDQEATADHFALLINGKTPELSVSKNGK